MDRLTGDHDQDDRRSEVPISLKIEPIKGTAEWTWAVTYDEGVKAVVRDYKLVPDRGKPNRFRIDERNGVALECAAGGRGHAYPVRSRRRSAHRPV